MVSLKQSALWSLWPMVREMPQRMLMTTRVPWICLLIPYCKQTNKKLFSCHSVYARLSTKFSLPNDEEKWLGLWGILDLRRKSWWGQTGPCLSRGSGSLEEGLLPMGETDICPFHLSILTLPWVSWLVLGACNKTGCLEAFINLITFLQNWGMQIHSPHPSLFSRWSTKGQGTCHCSWTLLPSCLAGPTIYPVTRCRTPGPSLHGQSRDVAKTEGWAPFPNIPGLSCGAVLIFFVPLVDIC